MEQTYAFAVETVRAPSARALQAAVLGALPPARVVRAREGIVIVLMRTGPSDDARAIAETLRDAISAEFGDPEVSVGYGGPRERDQALRTLALHAEHGLLLGRALNGRGRVTAFRDLGPYCFVLGRPTGELQSFCAAILGPLADGAQREELRTLREFLRAHGSVNAAARALFLHRNTVRQRLKRIGELDGADLDDADTRMALHLAVLGQSALEALAS